MTAPTTYWQFAYGATGTEYLFGAGLPVQLLSIDGLEDAPPVRTQDITRGFADGMYTGRDFFQGRIITMHLQILADANGSMVTNLQAMKNALVPNRQGLSKLSIYLPNRSVQFMWCRVRRRSIQINPDYVYGRAEAMVEFFCPDPRIYDPATSVTLGTASQLGRSYFGTTGRSYSGATGRSYATAGAAASASGAVVNNGSTATPATITMTTTGSVTNATFTNAATGTSFGVATTIGTTDTLTIYTDPGVVLLNGNPVRNVATVGSSFWLVQPGSNAITVTFGTTTGTPNIVVTTSNAYI